MAGDDFDVVSAGSEETPLDPDAIAAMREEVGLCDRQKERSCPIFPGAIRRAHWDLKDPSQAPTPGDRSEAMRCVRDDIQHHVMDFVNEHRVPKGKEQRA